MAIEDELRARIRRLQSEYIKGRAAAQARNSARPVATPVAVEPAIDTLEPVEPPFSSSLDDSGKTGPAPSPSDPNVPYGAFGDSTGTTTILPPDKSGVVGIERETYPTEKLSDETEVTPPNRILTPRTLEEYHEALTFTLKRLEEAGEIWVIMAPSDTVEREEAPYVGDGEGIEVAPYVRDGEGIDMNSTPPSQDSDASVEEPPQDRSKLDPSDPNFMHAYGDCDCGENHQSHLFDGRVCFCGSSGIHGGQSR